MLTTTLQNVRYGWRLLRRQPVFAFTAVLSLAVGIGANTTIFTIANALLFRTPAGVAEPERLVDIGRAQDRQGFDTNSYPNYLDIRARTTTLAGIYAYRPEPQPMSLGSRDGAERVYGQVVSNNYFDVLGVQARVGRMIRSDDPEAAGANPILVLAHRAWMGRFNGDPAIVGREVALNGHLFVVAGVAAEGFQGTSIFGPDLWVPISMVAEAIPRMTSPLGSRETVWLVMGGRLAAGASIGQAQAEFDVIGASLERDHPTANRGKSFRVLPSSAIPGQRGQVAGFMAVLVGLVALVLAIACANIVGVLLARAASRRKEMAVRRAIGAGRGRLIGQMLTETTILFAAGAVAGLVLARGMTTVLVSKLPTLPVPVQLSLGLDTRVVAFTLGLTCVAALLSGLAPALQASSTDVVHALKDGDRGSVVRVRVRNVFVVAQVALSLVLVVAGGLLVRALAHASSIDPGFDPHGVELASLDFSLGGYTGATGPSFGRELMSRVREVPGVEAASLSRVMPLGGSRMQLGSLTVPGTAPPDGQTSFEADWNIVEPGYFATMRTALIRGRDFDARDREGSPPVVIVNETAARTFWPGQDPIGRPLVQQTGANAFRSMTVVAVARDGKYRGLGDPSLPFVYVPFQQQYSPRMTIVARTSDARRIAGELRRVVAALDPNLPIVTSQTLEDLTSFGLVPQRVAASVAGSLGAVGLVLAAMGIYGVTAYSVARRTREIGVRVALGARRGDVLRLVIRQGMTLAVAGIVIGVTLALAASRLLATLLFGLPASDPVTFVGSIVLFAAIGLAACIVPARRATRIAAIDALRSE